MDTIIEIRRQDIKNIQLSDAIAKLYKIDFPALIDETVDRD